MVTLGRTLDINGELYEIVKTLKIRPGVVFDSDFVEDVKSFYRADKLFKRENTYYFVNLVQDVDFEMVDTEVFIEEKVLPMEESTQEPS